MTRGGEEVTVVWWMHACIELIYRGKHLFIDPHDGGSIGVGVPKPPRRADYVLVTHNHYDHNAAETVAKPDAQVVMEREGVFQLGPFQVKGLKLPHDEFNGSLRGWVTAYMVEAGGLRLLHLGDIGAWPREDELEAMRGVDVVFVPAGDVYTLPVPKAVKLVEEIGARIVVPIHYWLPGIHLPLEPLDRFLSEARRMARVRLDTNEFRVSRDTLPERQTLVVPAPPRRG